MRRKRREKAAEPRDASSFAYRPFAVLKDLVAPPRTASTMPGHPAPQPDAHAHLSTACSDEELFWQAMHDVRRLWPEGPNLVDRRIPPPAAQVLSNEDAEVLAALADLVAGAAAFDITLSDEYVEGAVTDLDLRLLQRLRRGEFAYQAYVDLHGHTVEQAKEQIDAFLTCAFREGKRCVLIVHGRGKNSKDQIPVLKTRVVGWLSRGHWSRLVLAFCSARPCDGGTGALYVLLRRCPRERGKVRVANGVKW